LIIARRESIIAHPHSRPLVPALRRVKLLLEACGHKARLRGLGCQVALESAKADFAAGRLKARIHSPAASTAASLPYQFNWNSGIDITR
jgi:hypothetical protein